MVNAKNDLIDAGVVPDHIFVVNSSDISKSPGVAKLEKTMPGITELMHNVTVAYNANLNQAMTSTGTYYDIPASHIFSAYDTLNDVMNDPAQYGFNNTQDSCVGRGAMPYCDGYVFYDDKHPTVALGKVFAQKINQIISTQTSAQRTL